MVPLSRYRRKGVNHPPCQSDELEDYFEGGREKCQRFRQSDGQDESGDSPLLRGSSRLNDAAVGREPLPPIRVTRGAYQK